MSVTRLGEAPPGETGGKASGLARLVELGLPVPPAVVVPASEAGDLKDPEGLLPGLGEPLAVRSSAIGEDAADRSAAGQYETILDVALADLPAAVDRVLESAFSERARAYRATPGARMAVIVQRQVRATRSGVAFSCDPLTGAPDVLIECVFGAGERLVAGLVDPDRFWVEAGGTVRARLAAKDGPHRLLRTFRDDEARRVAELTRRAEEGFGRPVDVEFCFEGPDLWLVQCRPITTLRR
jgi:rifampicin phosphotransferase